MSAAPQLLDIRCDHGHGAAIEPGLSLVVRMPTAKPCEATETTDSGGMEAVGIVTGAVAILRGL